MKLYVVSCICYQQHHITILNVFCYGTGKRRREPPKDGSLKEWHSQCVKSNVDDVQKWVLHLHHHQPLVGSTYMHLQHLNKHLKVWMI